MIERQVVNRTTYYQSEVRPEIETRNCDMALAIAWADEHPTVWKVVRGTKSKAFGRKSCVYIGWAQNTNAPEAVLERVHHLHSIFRAAPHTHAHDIFLWRAAFTLDHYEERGFKGGFFQQWDKKYPRGCLSLDYTPETLPEVLEQFKAWVDGETVRITIDGETVRTYGEEVVAASD